MHSQKKTATAYLQVSRDPRRPWASEARVIKSTQKKPEVVEPGCVVVKIQIRLPDEVWSPFEPEAVIDVPAELVQRPIDVEAVDGSS